MYAVIAPNMGKQIVALQARNGIKHTDGRRHFWMPDIDSVAVFFFFCLVCAVDTAVGLRVHVTCTRSRCVVECRCFVSRWYRRSFLPLSSFTACEVSIFNSHQYKRLVLVIFFRVATQFNNSEAKPSRPHEYVQRLIDTPKRIVFVLFPSKNIDKPQLGTSSESLMYEGSDRCLEQFGGRVPSRKSKLTASRSPLQAPRTFEVEQPPSTLHPPPPPPFLPLPGHISITLV